MSNKTLEEVIKQEIAAYPERWRHSVSCWLAIKKENKEVYRAKQSGAPCHAGLTSMVTGRVILNAHKPQCHGKFPDFTKWVAQQSPFSHGVLNKDNEKEILGQGIVIDGDAVGRGGALWLVKGLRYTVEDTFRIPTWRTLQEEGLDPLQAFIGCSILDSLGSPQLNRTHCGLFRYDTPASIYSWYQELLKEGKREGDDASRPAGWTNFTGSVWGSLSFKVEKKPDGWGGFTEVKKPSDPKEFVEKLTMIFAGDYKNVK